METWRRDAESLLLEAAHQGDAGAMAKFIGMGVHKAQEQHTTVEEDDAALARRLQAEEDQMVLEEVPRKVSTREVSTFQKVSSQKVSIHEKSAVSVLQTRELLSELLSVVLSDGSEELPDEMLLVSRTVFTGPFVTSCACMACTILAGFVMMLLTGCSGGDEKCDSMFASAADFLAYCGVLAVIVILLRCCARRPQTAKAVATASVNSERSERARSENHGSPGSAALVISASKGHVKCMDLLLTAGVSMGCDDAVNGEHAPISAALISAVVNGEASCVKYLVGAKAQIEARNEVHRALTAHISSCKCTSPPHRTRSTEAQP